MYIYIVYYFIYWQLPPYLKARVNDHMQAKFKMSLQVQTLMLWPQVGTMGMSSGMPSTAVY